MTEIEELRKALEGLQAFVGIMFGQGPDAIIPETITTPLGLPVQIGALMRDAAAALASKSPPSTDGVVERVARALARSDGLGDHMPNTEPWKRHARVAVEALSAQSPPPIMGEDVIERMAEAIHIARLVPGKAPEKWPLCVHFTERDYCRKLAWAAALATAPASPKEES